MNEKLETLIPQLEKLLSKETYVGFYIGKTNDYNSRECEHMNDGFAFFWVFAHGNSEAINQGEIDLINYFKSSSPLKSKCMNKNNGGGGSPDATYLYVAVNFKTKGETTIDDLHDDVLNPFEPLIQL